MSKQIKKYDELYSNIELVPDEAIKDTDDPQGFDVDWDLVEEKYQQHRHRHHHHSSGHSHHHSSHSEHLSDSKEKNQKGKQKKTPKKKWSKKKKILIGILIFFICLIIGLISTFFILRYLGKQAMLNYDNLNITVPDGIDYDDNGRIIYYNGHTYQFNENIASVLFMGIDNRELKENAIAGTAGQADALYLFTYNALNGEIKVLSLNRDTMTDISRYDAGGKYYDTTTTQLCLAYAYGDGKTLSAENQVTAVERLLYNIPINAYYAINLDAIKILNDDIGGVTLTPEYTFGSFVKGQQTTIKGDMAEAFVRHRDTSLLDDNLRRMACQRLYINSFANQIVPAIKKDLQVPIKLYQHSSDYTVTNIQMPILTYLASSLATKFTGLNMKTTNGKYIDNPTDAAAQFKIDKKPLFETVLDFYYTRID
ncbi:MAG: hypothetical protein HFG31_06120 [Eubacterium sp.]|nr:hypothetical protein [Eubacterium sp.]